jgi:Spx/MgsR family transcriptional regulator
MKVKVYGYRGCSTCKKAYAFLGKKAIAFDEVDITEKAPSKKELKAMLARVDGNLKKLFNTSGQVYREQKLGDKLPHMSESDALELLAGNGRLVKRPFLVVDGEAETIGFDEAKWKAALSS